MGRIETKKKKEVKSGFQNIYDFRIDRKEGPDYQEINSWIEQSETVDYIELLNRDFNFPLRKHSN